MRVIKGLFATVWIGLVVFLLAISFQYKDRAEALTALVESQESAISFQKPVVVNAINVSPGQVVSKGDTLIKVSQPSLDLDIERKSNELLRLKAEVTTTINNHTSKIQLLSLERDGKINRLVEEKNQIESEINQQRAIRQQLSTFTGQTTSDSLALAEYNSLISEIRDVQRYFEKEIQRQLLLQQQQVEDLEKEIDLNAREYEALIDEKGKLIQIANFDGIVASADVQLNELVPPYKKVVSVYEIRPTVIKAFMNERYRLPIQPGDRVKVVSENRLYSIMGVVSELGARITPYPMKIMPDFTATQLYGQEVFISIAPDNQFLNGEKVFVYPQINGKE